MNIAPLIGALGWSMPNTRDVDDDISREAAKLLRRVIEAVAKGELEARTPDARALLRRLEGALIALEASSPKGESEHVHDLALRKPRVFCTELRRRCPPRTIDLDSRPLFYREARGRGERQAGSTSGHVQDLC